MSGQEGADTSPAPSSCRACRAELPADAQFCTACGTPVTQAPRGRRSRRADPDVAVRRAARSEFGRIKSIVLTVRSIFWASAVVAALHVAIAFLVGRALATDRELGWFATLLKVVTVGELVMTVAGALLVLRAPLVWTTVAACYFTLNTAGALWVGDYELSPMMLVRLLLVASFWFAVAQAGRVQKLMAEDPSLQIVRKRLDPAKRVVGGVADQAAARQREQRRRERRQRWQLIGGVAAGVVVVGVVLWQLLKPPTVDGALAAFRGHWAKNDAAAITAMFRDGGPRGAAGWSEAMERRGWLATMPALEPGAVTPRGDAIEAVFACRAGDVVTRWWREESRWHLVDLDLPTYEFPDHAPAVEQFRRAWAAPGTQPLAELFRPASRERLGKTLVRVLEQRGWHERRPALGVVDVGRPREGRVRLQFPLGDGDVSVAVEYWHPGWWVTSVALPRQ